jgi:hypothetical protein
MGNRTGRGFAAGVLPDCVSAVVVVPSAAELLGFVFFGGK